MSNGYFEISKNIRKDTRWGLIFQEFYFIYVMSHALVTIPVFCPVGVRFSGSCFVFLHSTYCDSPLHPEHPGNLGSRHKPRLLGCRLCLNMRNHCPYRFDLLFVGGGAGWVGVGDGNKNKNNINIKYLETTTSTK